MAAADRNWINLCDEHGAVVREYGRAQQRASDLIGDLVRRVEALEAQIMRLRAAAIIRETALVWTREELEAARAPSPGVSRRPGRTRQASAAPSACRGQVVVWVSQGHTQAEGTEPAIAKTGVRLAGADGAGAEQLDAGLADADLVICQAGCVSYGDWWRVQDYCSRTGKQCVLVEQPDALERVIESRAEDTGRS